MNQWWKNPVLHGPENDYGDYDYLIEELPSDHAEWSLQRYTSEDDFKEIALSDEDYNECFDKFIRLIAKNGNRY